MNKTKREWQSISLPKEMVNEIKYIVKWLHYWSSINEFCREAVLKSIRAHMNWAMEKEEANKLQPAFARTELGKELKEE